MTIAGRIVLLAAPLLLVPAVPAGAQGAANVLPADAGRAVSTAFLLDLTNPTRTMPQYRVGVVDANLGLGMLVSPKGAPPAVELIAGAGQENAGWSRALVSAAADHIRDPQTNDFRFHVVRKILTAQNCPKMVPGVTDFYAGLEAALSAPINLADRPPLQRGIAADAGDYRIQITVDSAVLTLSRLGEMEHPLSNVLGPLVWVLMTCAASIPASSEQSYSFSYQQAIVRKDLQ